MNVEKTLDEILGEWTSWGFDSRDVIERLQDLDSRLSDDPDDPSGSSLSEDERQEIGRLREIVEECSEVSDWQYGEQFILDLQFEEFARELAEDVCSEALGEAQWPVNCIDWAEAARQLKQDYTEFEIEGYTYWARS